MCGHLLTETAYGRRKNSCSMPLTDLFVEYITRIKQSHANKALWRQTEKYTQEHMHAYSQWKKDIIVKSHVYMMTHVILTSYTSGQQELSFRFEFILYIARKNLMHFLWQLVVDWSAAKSLCGYQRAFSTIDTPIICVLKPAFWLPAPENSLSCLHAVICPLLLPCTKHPTSSAEVDKEKSICAEH